MTKLIKRYKQGNKSPDHDPDNPYHYHTGDGKKVVITPEDWEANVGKPYFKEIEDAVRAEQATHPGPEYEVNPDFVRDLRSTYRSNMGNGYQNYRNFSSYLPQGYTFSSEGMIVDPQGNYYVQSGYRQSPRFTYSTDNPLNVNLSSINKNLTFYPVNMDKRVKASLPVDRVMNVDKEKEKAITDYIANSKNKLIKTPGYSFTLGYNYNTINNKPVSALIVHGSAPIPILDQDVPIVEKWMDEHENNFFKNDFNYTEDEIKDLLKLININNIIDYKVFRSYQGNKPHFYYKEVPTTRQEAEKKAVISIGPLEKVNTFATGGQMNTDGPDDPPTNIPKKSLLTKVDEAVLGNLMEGFRKIAIPGAVPTENPNKNISRNNLGGTAQRTYLLPRWEQREVFLNDGYIEGIPKDYGLVKKAVGNRDLPVYQTAPDAVSRQNLVPFGNLYGFESYGRIDRDKDLLHVGSHPAAVYVDGTTGKIYLKGWDLNDYGGNSGEANNYKGLKKIGANVLDVIGSPTVLTTGYQAVTSPSGFDKIENGATVSDLFGVSEDGVPYATQLGELLDNFMATKGLHREELNGEQVYTLPEVKITAERPKALGGHLYQDGGPIKIGYAAGGKLKLIPRALRGIPFSVILQPAVADNTRYVRPYTSIEIAKSKKAYEQEQLQKLIESAQERLPLLKADTRSTEQRQRDHNRAIQLEVKQKANELAANFGRALGANHDMTVDEVNQNTLNTANLMGYMVAPYLMTTLESGYYLGTGRPKEAAITAGIGYGLPALNKPLANVSNTTKAIVVSNRLKKGIKNTTLPAQEPLIDVNPIYNFIDNGTPFNGKLPLIGYVKGNLELFPNRPLILRPEKSYHTIDRAYLESSLPDFVKDSGLRNMLKQTYESISESTPSSELVTSINHTLGIEPKIPNDKFITGGVDKVKWLNDKPIFISKTPEEIYHPKFVRDAYKKPNEQVVDETYDIFRQRILDKFGIKLKENYDAKDIEDAFYSLETPTTDDFSKVMHNERWYNPDFNDDQKLFAEYFNQYFGLKNKNFVSYIDLKNAVKEGLQFGIDYLKSPGFTERATNMLNKYGFSYSPSDFKLNSRKVTWMPEFMNADSSLLFGLSSRRRLPFRLGGTATHEVFHWNPKFNTRINSSKGITLTKPADSPYYSNNYNNIPEDVKAILRPNKEKLIARELKGLGDLEHDAEISESYSDLEELRYNLKKEGIFDSFKSGEKFDLRMLDLFRKTKRGKTDRFIDLHNDDQIIKAINEIAQNGNEEISYV